MYGCSNIKYDANVIKCHLPLWMNFQGFRQEFRQRFGQGACKDLNKTIAFGQGLGKDLGGFEQGFGKGLGKSSDRPQVWVWMRSRARSGQCLEKGMGGVRAKFLMDV